MSKNTVTQEHIQSILDKTEFRFEKVFDKCLITVAKLPNGFIIVESSACVDPANYDEKIGYDICMNRIENKIWELEGYVLQKEVSNK